MPKKEKRVCLCDTKYTRGYSRYYDYPDGCDISTKIMVAARYGAVAGLILSTYDVLMYSHAVGFNNILLRYLVHTAPLAGMGATFATVANAAQHARQKDDEWNYVLGGVACSPILAHYVGTKQAIVPAAVLLGMFAYIKKTAVDKNWTFFPDVTPHMGTVTHWRNDYTLAKDPGMCGDGAVNDVDDSGESAD